MFVRSRHPWARAGAERGVRLHRLWQDGRLQLQVHRPPAEGGQPAQDHAAHRPKRQGAGGEEIIVFAIVALVAVFIVVVDFQVAKFVPGLFLF